MTGPQVHVLGGAQLPHIPVSSLPSSARAPEAIMVNTLPATQYSPHSQPGSFVPSPVTTAPDAAWDIDLATVVSSELSASGTLPDKSQGSAGASYGVFSLAGSNYYEPYILDPPPPLKTEPVSPAPRHAALHDGLPTSPTSTGLVSSSFQSAAIISDSPVAEKPKLYFAIQNSKGMPDTTPSQLISGPTFRDSSLAGFFELVGSRSNKPPTLLTDITLRYTWINQNAVVVNRHIGEEAWGDIKEDVLEFFRMSREDDSARKRFHVWVRVGDTTKATKNTSRDDI